MNRDARQIRFDDGKEADALRTIGEVASALDIRQHVLRYWEQQFPMLRPLKRSGGRRYYRPEDVALVETIDRLINREGYTLKGARQAIERGASGAAGVTAAAMAPVPVPPSSLPEKTVQKQDDAASLALEKLRGIRDRLARALAA